MSINMLAIVPYWPQIISGFLTTIGVWVGAVVLGMVLGLFVAVLQLFGGPWVRALLRIYIEVLRTTPFLIQLFVLYYGGPSVGIELSAMTAGVVALAFYGSAYFAEAFRRSEEHTSELQSLMRISYAVFCLDKKNITHKQTPNQY